MINIPQTAPVAMPMQSACAVQQPPMAVPVQQPACAVPVQQPAAMAMAMPTQPVAAVAMQPMQTAVPVLAPQAMQMGHCKSARHRARWNVQICGILWSGYVPHRRLHLSLRLSRSD